VKVNLEDVVSAAVSPANSAWTRISVPGHAMRTNVGTFVGFWEFKCVFRDLPSSHSAMATGHYSVVAADTDWIDLDLNMTSLGLSYAGLAGTVGEFANHHSDMIQTIHLRLAEEGDYAFGTGYDNIVLGNIFYIGDAPSPYENRMQSVFLENDAATDVKVLVAFNTMPCSALHGITINHVENAHIINNVALSGRSGANGTFIQVPNVSGGTESVWAGNITNQLLDSFTIAAGGAVYNNLEVTGGTLASTFANPTFTSGQLSATAVVADYTSNSTLAAQRIGTGGTGVVDYVARTYVMPPYVGIGRLVATGTTLTATIESVDPDATVHYVLTLDDVTAAPTYTGAQIKDATVSGNILAEGSTTAALARAGIVLGTSFADARYIVHFVAENSLGFGVVRQTQRVILGATPQVLSAVQTVQTPAATNTHTHTAISVYPGAEKIVVMFSYRGIGAVTTVTIGGIAATKIDSFASSTGVTSQTHAWFIDNAAGLTTVDVVITGATGTAGGSSFLTTMGVYGYDTFSMVSQSLANGDNAMSRTFAVLDGDYLVAQIFCTNVNFGSPVWNNLTQSYAPAALGSLSHFATAATAEIAADNASYTASAAWTGDTRNMPNAILRMTV